MRGDYEWEPDPVPSWGVRSVLDAFDWDHVRAEVERECQGRVVIVGLRGVGKSSLLNQLRGWEVSPVGDGRDTTPQASEVFPVLADGPGETSEVHVPVEDLGLFVLVDLPDHGPWAGEWQTGGDLLSGGLLYDHNEVPWVPLAEADLIVFVLDAETLAHPHEAEERPQAAEQVSAEMVNLRPVEYQWFCRIRTLGPPLIVALNKVDVLDGRLEEIRAELERRLAVSVMPVSVRRQEGIDGGLLPGMLDAWPGLAVPLGRELPEVRRLAAMRLIRRAALLSALTGLEPVPLVDIPIQLAAQMRLLLRLAALHGQLESGDGSRELLATVAGGLGLRYAAQQAAKLVPILGWGVSGLLSGLSTWLLGWAAMAYFEGRLQGAGPHLRRLPAFGCAPVARWLGGRGAHGQPALNHLPVRPQDVKAAFPPLRSRQLSGPGLVREMVGHLGAWVKGRAWSGKRGEGG